LGGELDPAPGRVFAVGPSVSCERFAEAINIAFGRWDMSHLHRSELAGEPMLGFPDLDFAPPGWVDHAAKLGSLVGPGMSSCLSSTSGMTGAMSAGPSPRSSIRGSS